MSPPRATRRRACRGVRAALALLVGLRRRHDADLQPAETVDLVVFNLGERELLAQARGCSCRARRRTCRARRGSRGCAAAPASSGARGSPTSARRGGSPSPRSCCPSADGTGRSSACLRHDRLLAGDHGQVADGGVECLGVDSASPSPMLTTIFVSLGTCIGFPYSNCLWSAGTTSACVARAGVGRSRLDLQLLAAMAADADAAAVVERSCAIRVGLSQLGQTTMTLPIDSGWARSRIPPWVTFGVPVVRPRALARLRVALGDVHALDDDRGRHQRRIRSSRLPSSSGLLQALRVAIDALDRAALAGVLAGQDHDGVAARISGTL